MIEGSLKAGLSVQADTLHPNTQGPSSALFVFTHLLGIKLMRRIHNSKDLVPYPPAEEAQYHHIDRPFTETIGWTQIEQHWQDLKNTVDLMCVLRDVAQENEPVRPQDIELLSPYLTHNLKRFGNDRLHPNRNIRPAGQHLSSLCENAPIA